MGGRTLRKKIVAGIALLALLGLILAMALHRESLAVPVQAGMTGEEVDVALGQYEYGGWCSSYWAHQGVPRLTDGMRYRIGLDGRGNEVVLCVYFDKEYPFGEEVPRVVSWRKVTYENSWWFQFRYITKMPHIDGVPNS
jgi:hypothetical protein